MSEGTWVCENCGYHIEASWGQVSMPPCPRCDGDPNYHEKIKILKHKLSKNKKRVKPNFSITKEAQKIVEKIVVDSIEFSLEYVSPSEGKKPAWYATLISKPMHTRLPIFNFFEVGSHSTDPSIAILKAYKKVQTKRAKK